MRILEIIQLRSIDRPLVRLSEHIESTLSAALSGEQAVTLVSASLFLRTEAQVTVPAGGQTVIEAPGVGRINVRAFPDNCEIFVGGGSVGYPPIQNREVVAGRHKVSFRWPDGSTSDQTIEVEVGRPTFVTGRKE